MNLRGTQLPNLSGNSDIKSSLILSFNGPKIITGLMYFTETNKNKYQWYKYNKYKLSQKAWSTLSIYITRGPEGPEALT